MRELQDLEEMRAEELTRVNPSHPTLSRLQAPTKDLMLNNFKHHPHNKAVGSFCLIRSGFFRGLSKMQLFYSGCGYIG